MDLSNLARLVGLAEDALQDVRWELERLGVKADASKADAMLRKFEKIRFVSSDAIGRKASSQNLRTSKFSVLRTREFPILNFRGF